MKDFLRISSKDNEQIKLITKLHKSSKLRREEGIFILEGLRLCSDAIQNGFVPVRMFVSDKALENYKNDVENICQDCENYILTDTLFAKISDTITPQGILGLFKIPDYSAVVLNDKGKYIALDNVQDPANLGAISRTAEAFGIDGIVLKDGCDPFSSKSLRASMGALLRIPIIKTDDLFDTFNSKGIKTYAAVLDKDSVRLNDVSFFEGCAVIIGNEANGVSEYVKNNCDAKIIIPMNGKAESLNAAVAASIVMWEMCK